MHWSKLTKLESEIMEDFRRLQESDDAEFQAEMNKITQTVLGPWNAAPRVDHRAWHIYRMKPKRRTLWTAGSG